MACRRLGAASRAGPTECAAGSAPLCRRCWHLALLPLLAAPPSYLVLVSLQALHRRLRSPQVPNQDLRVAPTRHHGAAGAGGQRAGRRIGQRRHKVGVAHLRSAGQAGGFRNVVYGLQPARCRTGSRQRRATATASRQRQRRRRWGTPRASHQRQLFGVGSVLPLAPQLDRLVAAAGQHGALGRDGQRSDLRGGVEGVPIGVIGLPAAIGPPAGPGGALTSSRCPLSSWRSLKSAMAVADVTTLMGCGGLRGLATTALARHLPLPAGRVLDLAGFAEAEQRSPHSVHSRQCCPARASPAQRRL